MRLALFAVLLAVSLSACGGAAGTSVSILPPRLAAQVSGTDALLIAAHAVDEDIVWASGARGTVVKTTDGGVTWTAVPVTIPGADTLQYRDVVAFDAQTAWALSIGNGAASTLALTTDGGTSWRNVFINNEPDAFYDCVSFWSPQRGLTYSDSVDGELRIRTTTDGGRTWPLVPQSALPPAAEGEGGFAASGTCVATRGDSLAWIATGNADPARVLRTTDGGQTWEASDLPIVAGEAAGAASVAFRTDRHGVAVGGDIANGTVYADAVAITSDGGRTWRKGGQLPFPGAAYGAAYVPGTDALVVVGPGGVGLSRDDGLTWQFLDGETFWGVASAGPDATWLTGPEGRIVRLEL